MNIIHDTPPKLDKSDWVAIDLELCGAEENKLHRPTTGTFGCLTFCAKSNPDDVYIVEESPSIAYALSQVHDATWILHYSKFDITHLRRWADIQPRKKLWDTYVIEKELWGGYYDSFGLDDLVRRYFSVRLDKSLQKTWGDLDFFVKKTGETTFYAPNYQQLIEYSAKDALWTLKCCLEQQKLITTELLKVYKEIDLPVLWATLDFKGFPINVEQWMNLAKENKQRQLDADAQLDFNPRSHAIAKQKLIESGFVRLPNVQRETLIKFSIKYPNTKAAELAQIMAISSVYGKRASTYGENFIEYHLEKEGDVDVIHCDYNIVGAETGRFSANSPNMQNIPSRDTLEFRDCFIARPGHKLIVIDYSQQEIGIMAYVSRDEKLLDVFNSGSDVYLMMYKTIYGEEITKDNPLRKQMKAVVLGLDYGMSPEGLAEKEEMSLEDAEQVTQDFFSTFHGVNRWMNKQKKIRDKVYTVMGRRIWLNPYSGQAERNACNSPVQGTAADMMKKALAKMHKEWKWKCPFGVVATVHDEVVLDVPEDIAEEVGKWAANISSEVANQMCNEISMNFRVDMTVCDKWSEKK